MKISLTKDLEDYVKSQMNTGHYASASEVVREALRNQIKLSLSNELDERIALGRREVAEKKVIPADNNFFDTAREYVKNKYVTNPA